MKTVSRALIIYMLCVGVSVPMRHGTIHAKSSHKKTAKKQSLTHTKPYTQPQPPQFTYMHSSDAGSLDTDFGTNGMVTTEFGTVTGENHVMINGLTTYQDTLIAVGTMPPTTHSPDPVGIIARYQDNGKPDTTYNALGYTATKQPQYNAALMLTPPHSNCAAIITAGNSYFRANRIQQFQVAAEDILRTCHWSFFGAELLTFPGSIRSEARAMAFDSQWRIVMGGWVARTNTERHSGLTRTSDRGALDASFGTNGFVQTDLSDMPNNLEQINAVAVTSDNSIIVAGQALLRDEQRFVIARYTSEGKLDTSFGDPVDTNNPTDIRTGSIFVDFASVTATPFRNDSARAVIILPDGTIVVAGYAHNSKGTFSVVVARFMPDGTIDTDFGSNGMVAHDFESVSVRAYALALQKNGSLVVAGSAIAPLADDPKRVAPQFMVARYYPEGTIDFSFGTRGISYAPFNNEGSEAYALTIDNKERIVVGGYNFDSHGVARFALARFLP